MFYILPLFEDYIRQCYKIDINELSSREIGKQKWRKTKLFENINFDYLNIVQEITHEPQSQSINS
jgi:hypothetical protein